MSNPKTEDSRHGPENTEEREFSQSLGTDGRTRGFFRDLMKASEEKSQTDGPKED